MKKLLYLLMLSISVQVYADDLNKRTGISPKVQIKVNKQIAKFYIKQKTAARTLNNRVRTQRYSSGSGSGSSNNVQAINNVSNVRYGPKEVITAVRGDIVNICFHCR